MNRLRLGLALLAACGCTLIVDSQINGVKAPDGGGSSDGGGSPDSGSGGTDSGGGGSDSGPGGDAGVLPPCDVNPRLRCDAPIVLGSGVANTVRLATVNGNFLAAFVNDGGIALREVRSSGVTVASRTIATTVVPPTLSLAGSGSHWTLVWADTNAAASDAFCSTDAMDGGAQLMDFASVGGSGPFGMVAAGMSSDGGVAVEVAKRYDSFAYSGTSRGVCPTQYNFFQDNFDNGADGISVVSMNVPTGDDGWRFGANAGGFYEFVAFFSDGGAAAADEFTNDSLNIQLHLQLSGVASASSTRVHAVVLAQPDAGQYELDTYALDATAFQPPDQTQARVTLYPGPVDDFTAASCPASTPAIATAFIPAVTTGDVSVAFMRDDPSEAPLGRGTYDVACQQNFASSTSSVSVACAGGRVGVLFSNNLSSSSQVQLYLCDLPF